MGQPINLRNLGHRIIKVRLEKWRYFRVIRARMATAEEGWGGAMPYKIYVKEVYPKRDI
jgi:hypothetical protein